MKMDIWKNLKSFLATGVADRYELTNSQLKIITGSTDRRLKPDTEIPEDNPRYTIGKWAGKAGFEKSTIKRNGIAINIFLRKANNGQ